MEEERSCLCTKVLKKELEVWVGEGWWGADMETKSKRARSINENVRAKRGIKIMGSSNRRTRVRRKKDRDRHELLP